ncbi:MAG: putative ABC transport system permease protein, partial [Saprospiraceae bacterium]
RKVLGASVSNIVLLFFKDFLWLIVIAVVIGVPLIYWSMSDWLGSYAYRIDFPWLVLILAVLMVTALAFFTVSIQTWKLAMLNPSKTIRTE